MPYKCILECKRRNIRNLKLRDFFKFDNRPFNAQDFRHQFVGSSSWTPPTSALSSSVITALNRISSLTHIVCSQRFLRTSQPTSPLISCRANSRLNLSQSELTAIQELHSNDNIVIKPADKGGAVVVLDKDLYKAEGLRQLLNSHYYLEIPETIADSTCVKINSVLQQLLDSGFITDKQFNFLFAKVPASPRSFYLLPKIHKARDKWPNICMPEGRPIVSDCGSETYNVCKFIDFFLKPLSCLHFSYIKDTYDFVSKIRGLIIPPDALLVTGDITALYTNMDIEHSLKVVREAFARHPDPNRPSDQILQLLEIALRNNDFTFAGRIFLQICGTAMGKTFAPSLANLYLIDFDSQACNGFHVKPLHFYRYLDDIFFLWPGSRQDLLDFNVFLNSILPGIKVTLTIRSEITEFLDTRIYKHHSPHQTVLHTRVFFKDTDTHQLLHGNSFHPRHTTRGILKSQLIRFKRLSSCKIEYDYACHTLFRVLRTRGYSRSLYRRLKSQIWTSDQYTLIRQHSPSACNIFPIVFYFDPIGGRLMKIFRQAIKDLDFLQSTKIVQANKIHRNLQRMLVSSRFVG